MHAPDPDGDSIPEINIGGMHIAGSEDGGGSDGEEEDDTNRLVPCPLPGLSSTLSRRAPALEERCFWCIYSPLGPAADRMADLFRESQFTRDPRAVFRDIQRLFNDFVASKAGAALPAEDRTWSLQCIEQHARYHCLADSTDRHLVDAVVMYEDILNVYKQSMGLKRKRDAEAVVLDPEAVKLVTLVTEKKIRYSLLLESRKKARKKGM